MGLRCSFLGHAYADPEIQRERDDRGDEVVVTVREVRTCTQCGAEEVVSENTEVRPVEPAPETASESGPEPEPDPGPAAGGGVSGGLDDELEAPQSAAEDDGVILDGEDEAEADPGREPGEWPDADDTRVDEAEADPEAVDPTADGEADATDDEADGWPDPEGEDEGFDAEPDAGEGEVEMGGLTPEGVSGGAAEGGATVGDDFDSGIERDASSVDAAGDEVDVDAIFVCPSCDYSVPVIDSSLRQGDICPECRKGYLAERSSTRN